MGWLTKQIVRKEYLLHAGYLFLLGVCLVILMRIPKIEFKENFIYAYALIPNVIPFNFSLYTDIILEGTVKGLWLGIVNVTNIMVLVVNVSILAIFAVQYRACHHDTDKNIMCGLPDNDKFCVGFFVIVSLFIIGNGIQALVVNSTKTYNNEVEIDNINSNYKKTKKYTGKNPIAIQFLHVKSIGTTILNIFLFCTTIFSILTTVLVDSSNISFLFIMQIVSYAPAIADIFGTLNLKRIWVVIFLSTFSSIISIVPLVLSILYYSKLCIGNNVSSAFMGDTTCVIGSDASVSYIIFHSIFLCTNVFRGIGSTLHVMYQSHRIEETVYNKIADNSSYNNNTQLMNFSYNTSDFS